MFSIFADTKLRNMIECHATAPAFSYIANCNSCHESHLDFDSRKNIVSIVPRTLSYPKAKFFTMLCKQGPRGHVPCVGEYSPVSPQKILTAQQSSDKCLSPIRHVVGAPILLVTTPNQKSKAQHYLVAGFLRVESSSWPADRMLTSKQSIGK